MKKKTILIITGPTASGKSDFAIECAKKFNGEIISADSMQIYRDLNIGTAKPSKEEQCGIKHYLIDVVDADEEFSVSDFVCLAKKAVEDISSRGKLPIIVGGTGLYIKSLIYPYSFCGAPKNEEIRNKYKKFLEENGKEQLFELLQKKDFSASQKIHINDTKRVIRALEIFEITNNTKTSLNKEENLESIYNPIFVVLNPDREILYERINKRVHKMFNAGLLVEFDDLFKKNKKLNKNNQSMQAIGYKELFKLKEEELLKPDCIELIKKNTRNYAKRQVTFMKGFGDAVWFDPLTQKKEIINYIKQKLND